MSYQPINEPIPKYYNGRKVWGKRDCEDFKAYFWDRKYCKLENNCKAEGYHCEGFTGAMSRSPKSCTGIARDRWYEINS